MDNYIVINTALNVLRPDLAQIVSKEVKDLAQEVLALHFNAEIIKVKGEVELLKSKNKDLCQNNNQQKDKEE